MTKKDYELKLRKLTDAKLKFSDLMIRALDPWFYIDQLPLETTKELENLAGDISCMERELGIPEQ